MMVMEEAMESLKSHIVRIDALESLFLQRLIRPILEENFLIRDVMMTMMFIVTKMKTCMVMRMVMKILMKMDIVTVTLMVM